MSNLLYFYSLLIHRSSGLPVAGLSVSSHRVMVTVARFSLGEEVNTRQNQTFRRLKKNRVRALYYPLHLQPDRATINTPDTLAGLHSILAITRDTVEDSPWPVLRRSIHDVLCLVKKQLEHIVQSQVESPPLMAFAGIDYDQSEESAELSGKGERFV